MAQYFYKKFPRWRAYKLKYGILSRYFALLLILLLLCCNISQFVNPGITTVLAIIALAYPIILMLNAVAAVIMLLVKYKRVAFCVVCILLFNLTIVPNFIGFPVLTTKKGNAKLPFIKVMTWNVHNFQPFSGTRRAYTVNVLNIIKDVAPDVLCLQEYYDQTNSGKRNISDSIKATGLHYYYFQRLKNNYTGIVIFSRFPITNQGDLRKMGAPGCEKCIFADVNIANKMCRVYTVHLQSYAISNKNEEESKLVYLKSTLNKLSIGFGKRAVETTQLKSIIARSPYPLVLTGDFNDTPISYTFNKLSKGLKNTFREKGTGYGNTFNHSAFPLQIDYIFVSPEFKVKGYNIVKRDISDHYPVVAKLQY